MWDFPDNPPKTDENNNIPFCFFDLDDNWDEENEENTPEKVITVAQTDPVDDCFYFGVDFPLEISGDFLAQFPVQENREMYQDMGRKAKDVIVSKCSGSQASEVLIYFREMRNLTATEISFHSTKEYLPGNLISLTLVDCRVNKDVFSSWTRRLGNCLEHLHLERVVLGFPISGEPTFLDSLTRLRSLTMKGMKMERLDYNLARVPMETLILKVSTRHLNLRVPDNNKLRHLEIETCAEMFLSGEFSQLEFVSLRSVQGRAKRDHLSYLRCERTLRSLSYNLSFDVDQVIKFRNLEEVKLHCSWYEEEELRERFKRLRNLKTVDLVCHLPIRGESGFIKTLNEDILAKIISYLPMEDCLSLGQVFPRLLCLLDSKESLTIDEIFLKKFPFEEFEEFYENLGKGLRTLKVSSLGEEKFLPLMERLQEISDLTLQRMELRDFEGIKKIPFVRKLTIGFPPDVEEEYWRKLFIHLDTNLESLTVEEPKFPLQELKNLREFSSEAFSSPEAMTLFLLQNENLRKIHLTVHRSSDKFPCMELEEPLHLEAVKLSVVKFEQIKPVLDSLNKETLKSLEIVCRSYKEEFLEIISSFINLEELILDVAIEWEDYFVAELSKLVNLKTLNVNGSLPKLVLKKMVKLLPKLRYLELGSHVEGFPCDFENGLKRFLQDNERELSINKADPLTAWNSY